MVKSGLGDKKPERHIALASLAATERLGEKLARILDRGDILLLYGALGAGKTALARAIITSAHRQAGEESEDVPSPSYTLVQSYEAGGLTITHVDLYRLAEVTQTVELGLEDALEEGAVLMEWPDRLGTSLPDDRLEIRLSGLGDERVAEILGHGSWAVRLDVLDENE